jgi:hypothetical protein
VTTPPLTPTSNKNYNLICALQASLHNVWQMENYAMDAERQGDAPVAHGALGVLPGGLLK